MAGSPLMFRDVISENIHRNHRASLSISQSMMVLRQVVSEILGQGLQLVVLYLGQQGLRAEMRAIKSEVRVSEVISPIFSHFYVELRINEKFMANLWKFMPAKEANQPFKTSFCPYFW